MSTPPPDKGAHTYVLDPESPAEMARLTNQGRFITKAMGGPLAEQTQETRDRLEHVIDLACGPGGWALDLAFTYQHMEVAGVDISRTMVDYANAQAQAQQLDNVSFGIMDITKPLDFADASFDLVNARFLVAVLRRNTWPAFLAECARILRPGGILRLTEGINAGITNSPAFQRGSMLGNHFLWRAGYGFSTNGDTYDITYMFPRMLRQHGFADIGNIGHAFEVSAETEGWTDFYRNMEVLTHLSKPALLQSKLVTEEEYNKTTSETLAEMYSKDFCGVWHIMTVYGTKG